MAESEPSTTGGSTKSNEAARHTTSTSTQYNARLDVILLRELVSDSLHPDDKGKGMIVRWEEINKRVNIALEKDKKFVVIRQTRDRAKVLMKKFKAEETISARASGVDEDYDEREKLLTEWADMMDNGLLDVKDDAKSEEKGKDQEKEKIARGLEIRKRAMEGLKPVEDDLISSSEDENDENPEHDADENVDPTPQKVRRKEKQHAAKPREKRTPPAKEKKSKVDKVMDFLKDQTELRRQELEIERNRSKQMTDIIRILAEKKQGQGGD